MVTSARPRPPAGPAAALTALAVLMAAVTACASSPGGSAGTGHPSAGTPVGSAPATGGAPDASGSPARGQDADPSRTPGLSSTDLPTLPRSGPPRLPNDQTKPVTVRGVVRISGTCTLLATDTVVWSLVGVPAPGVRDGQRIEVVGLPAPHEEPPCAGGALHVRTVRSW